MVPLDLLMEPFRQAGPVARLHQEGKGRLPHRLLKVTQLADWNLLQARPAQHEVEVAAVVAAPAHAAAVGPDFDTGQVLRNSASSTRRCFGCNGAGQPSSAASIMAASVFASATKAGSSLSVASAKSSP